MSDAALHAPADPIGERLRTEVGILAGRLAQFLASALPDGGGAVAEGQSFLRAASQAAGVARPLEELSGGPSLRRGALDEPHPIDRLAEALALTDVEIELLLLAGMADEHEGYAAVLRTLHPRQEPRASVGLAAQLLCPESGERSRFRAMLESGAAVRRGALRVTGEGPFFDRSLQPADSLWAALHGHDAWPASVHRVEAEAHARGLEEWLTDPSSALALEAVRKNVPCTILVTADGEEAALHRALALVEHAGRVPVALALPQNFDEETENLITLHACVRARVPVVRLTVAEGQATPDAPGFAGHPGPVVVCGRSGAVAARGSRPLLALDAGRLSPQSRREMWVAALPELSEQATFLAARYPVEPATAAEVASDARLRARLKGSAPETEDVAASVRARGGLTLSGGVKLLRPNATFDELVLPADRMSQLREAIKRLTLQSCVFDEWEFLKGRAGARGVRLMFAGPPGTGKTLAAEVLAHALSVDLLLVDISRVVSKWIGETEKNLAAVFDTAERAQAVLFFDEADALFGKRTEVSDAHDRYANLETAYLLARLERFEGLVVLATNLRQNIDPAFLRRMEFVVDFHEPDREERHALWRCHVPQNAPLADDVNLYELAALYPVVGGVVRNAAVAAAFLAASDGGPIMRSHFIHAIRREYEKAGRAFPGVPPGMRVS
jgi:hypothetical protein